MNKDLARRMAECKARMIESGLYLRPFSLRHTNVQERWLQLGWKRPSDTIAPPPVSEDGSTSSNSVPFVAPSAARK